MENKDQGENRFERVEETKVEEYPYISEHNEFKYINFIITHHKSKELKVYLPSEYRGSQSLEKINDKAINERNDLLTSDIYHFKIIKEAFNLKIGQEEYQIPVNIEYENEKYQYFIKLKDLERDFYEYNFEIKDLVYPLNYQKQFEIYLDILRNKFHKEQNTKENEDFILSTQSLLIEPNKNNNFLFYLSILLECFSTEIINEHLLKFQPEKMTELGEVSDIKLVQMKTKLNSLTMKPEEINIKNDRQEKIELFYTVVLYFNLHFQKEKVKYIFEKEQICEPLYEKFIKFDNCFEGLILPKKDVVKLIKMTDDNSKILNFLSYLGKDVILFFEVINEEKELFKQIFKGEEERSEKSLKKKKEIPYLDVSKYVYPKKEDDLKKLNKIIFEIDSCKQNNELPFFKFPDSFIDKYIEFNENNYNNLIYIRNIVQCSNSYNEFNFNKFNLFDRKKDKKYKLDKMIHQIGLNLVKNGEFKNIEILTFILSDKIFTDENFNKKKYRPLEIFDGIDIKLMEKKNEQKIFFNLWNKIDFYLMFECQLEEFLKKISSLIKDLKDFRFLFKLYKIDNEASLRYDVIRLLQNKLLELLPPQKDIEYPNLVEDVTKLIFLSDHQKKVDIKKFLLNIEKQLEDETVNNIYTNLIKKHLELSKDCNQKIVKYFTEHKEKINPISLAYLLDKSDKLKKDLCLEINKYILKQDEIFEKQESNNFIFLKELVCRQIFGIFKDKYQEYFEKLKNFHIKVKVVYEAFKEGKLMEDILKERISIVFFCFGKDSNIFFEELKSKAKTTIEKLDKLKSIKEYFTNFYANFHSENIKSIINDINSLKDEDLNDFEMDYETKYLKKYESYLIEEEETLKKKNSVFFNQIYKKSKKVYEKNDIKCFKEANEKFNKLINLFEENGIDKIDEKTLLFCVEPFSQKRNELSSEIKKIFEIFKISKDKNYDIENIKNDIILISKREYILNAISSIIFFIEKIGAKKGDYTNIITKVKIAFEEKNNISSSKRNEILLNNLDIDFINKENDYADILILLNKKEDEINFLLDTTIEECNNFKKIISEKKNKYITLKDILDLEKCIVFFMSLGELDKLYDFGIIKIFKENASKPENKRIIDNFKGFINNFARINELKSSLVGCVLTITKHFLGDTLKKFKKEKKDILPLFGKFNKKEDEENINDNSVANEINHLNKKIKKLELDLENEKKKLKN